MVAIVISGLALYLAGGRRFNAKGWIAGSLLAGLGVCVMHYNKAAEEATTHGNAERAEEEAPKKDTDDADGEIPDEAKPPPLTRMSASQPASDKQ